MMLYLGLPLTLMIYFAAVYCYKRTQFAILNPILWSILLLIAIIINFGLDLAQYESSTQILGYLLEPAVIALAFPLYQQFCHVRKNIKNIIISCGLGVIAGLVSTAFVASILTNSEEVIASLMPKSVTTPIAMAISESIGGIPAISAILVILVGIFGNIFAPHLIKLMRIKNHHAQGLALGAASHVVGTSKAIEMSHIHGAFSTIALLVSAIITAILAPVIHPFLLTLLN